MLLAYLEQPFTDLRIAAYRFYLCMKPCQCCEPLSVLCVSLSCMLMLKASLCRSMITQCRVVHKLTHLCHLLACVPLNVKASNLFTAAY